MNKIIVKKESYFKSKTHSWVMLFLSAVLYTLGIQMFIQVAGTFSVGLGAFAQIFTIIFKDLKNYFSIIYLILNIPLLIIFWKKLKKEFLIKTTFFLIVQAALGSLFLIPELNNDLINQLQFTQSKTNNIETIRNLVWPIFVLALLGGLFVGTSTAIAWKKGGSTAGSDIIVYFFSTTKKKPIGSIMLIVSLVIMTFSFSTVLIFNADSREHWLMVIFSTMSYVFITSFIVNIIYPKYSKVKVEIHSNKPQEIIKYFDSDKYNHSFQWTKQISGYTKKPKEIIISVMLLLEVKEVVNDLKAIDPDIWIMETNTRRITGSFNTTKVD